MRILCAAMSSCVLGFWGTAVGYVVFVGAGGDGDSVYGEKSGEIVFYQHVSIHQPIQHFHWPLSVLTPLLLSATPDTERHREELTQKDHLHCLPQTAVGQPSFRTWGHQEPTSRLKHRILAPEESVSTHHTHSVAQYGSPMPKAQIPLCRLLHDVCDKPVTSPDKTRGSPRTSPFLPVTSQQLFPLPTLIAVNPTKFAHSVYILRRSDLSLTHFTSVSAILCYIMVNVNENVNDDVISIANAWLDVRKVRLSCRAHFQLH